MKKKAITICFIASFLISSFSFFFFQANVLAANDLESKYSTINDQDNLYDSVPYWFNASLYDPDDLTRDFQSGLLSIEKEGTFGIKENFTLLNDFDNNYWDNQTEFSPIFGTGFYSDGVFYSSNVSFNYDYGYHPSTNYNESIYDQYFNSPDGSMSHNYQPDDGGYNSYYTINGNLMMYNEFPSEEYWEVWDSYSHYYTPAFTNSSFSPYGYVTNVSVQDGNGEYISGDEEDLKYGDSQYFESKSVEYLGDQILYIDFDFSNDYNWDELDGDYFLYFHANDTINFRDKNHQDLWSGSEAWGVLLNDIDDYIYIYDERVPQFSIQIDYLFLLEPELVSQLNYWIENIIPSYDNATVYRGTHDLIGLEMENNTYYGTHDFNDMNMSANTYYGSPDPFPPDIGKSSTDISWVDSVSFGGSSSVEIIASEGNHENVLKFIYDNIPNWDKIEHYFPNGAETSGAREFWWRCEVSLGGRLFEFQESGGGRTLFETDGSKLYMYKDADVGGSWELINPLVNDTWYHIRYEWESDNRNTVYIDGVKVVDNEIMYSDMVWGGLNRFTLPVSAGAPLVQYLGAWGDPADDNYSAGYNINPYDITQIWDGIFSSILCAHDSHIKISDVDGHVDVLELYDGTTTLDDGKDKVGGEITFTAQTSGTIELWIRSNDVTNMFTIYVQDGGSEAICISIAEDKIRYYHTGAWNDATNGGLSNNIWYHFRIDFDCSSDTFDFYLDGNLLDSDIPFNANKTSLNRLVLSTLSMYYSYTYYVDAIGFSWDTTSHDGLGYEVGYNLNPYDITEIWDGTFSSLYCAHDSWIKVNSSVDGHSDVLELYDGTGILDDSKDEVGGIISFTPQTSGTIEFWFRSDDVTRWTYIFLMSGSTGPYITIQSEKIRYYDGSWIDATGGGVLDNIWYHFRIDFDCDADTFDFYLDGVLLDSGIAFQNNKTTLNGLRISTISNSISYINYIDAIGFSWDPNYDVGDNIHPDCDFVFEDGFFDLNHPFGDLQYIDGSYVAFNSTIGIPGNVENTGWLTGSYTISDDWVNPDNARISDGQVTTPSYAYLNYIQVRNFSANIPSDATIVGIQAQIQHGCTNHEAWDVNVKMVRDGVMEGDNKLNSLKWAIGDGWYTYGGSSDLWGLTWTVDQINSPDMGFRMCLGLYNDQPYIDTMNVKIYYTLPVITPVLNFTTSIQLDFSEVTEYDTMEYIKLFYSHYSTNNTYINFSVWNYDTESWYLINSSNNDNGFYDNYFLLNSSFYDNNYSVLLKYDSIGHGVSYNLYLDKLKIEYKWIRTSGDIYSILSKSIVFDFLNYYDAFSAYLNLYRFDYIFTYRFTNYTNHPYLAEFNDQSLTTDGSWHTADFYSIYDSDIGDGTINVKFNISNGILEIRTFKYSMWFGCMNATGDKRILQQIFAVEWPEGSLSDFVAGNGTFLLNINYTFIPVSDAYEYMNTYGRTNYLEIHYAFMADGSWYYYYESINVQTTENKLINITNIMDGLGLSSFEDFAVTFVMIGNSSQITVFNVSLWDTRAVVPAFLNFTFDHEFVRDYMLNYFELLYDWNTTAYTLINFSLYDFQNDTYNLLKSDYNTGGDSLYSFVSYLFNYYQDSDNKTYIWVVSDYNYTTAFSLNLSVNFNYRTAIWVSHKLTFDERGVWRYRFVLTSSGSDFETPWIYFDVIESVPNFQAVSKSDYITNWILMSNDTASTVITRFSDDLMGDQWELNGVPSRYVWYEVYPYGDSYVWYENPDTNYGSETILAIKHYPQWKRVYIEDIHIPEDESDYFVNNVTGRPLSNFRFYGISGDEEGYMSWTSDFDENTITYNNAPAPGSQIGWAIPYGSGWKQFYNIPYTNPGRYIIEPGTDLDSYQNFYSKESGSNKPYFRHYVSKNYHDTSSGYFYMQTNVDEILSMISSKFSTTQAYINDFILIDCQTLNSDLDVIFLKNGAIVKTLPLVRDNVNYDRHSIEVLIDEDISFDQIKISGQFSEKEFFKCYNIKIQGYEFEEQHNIIQFGVAPDSSTLLFAPSGENILKIYDRGILKVEKTILLTYDDVYIEEYIGLVLETVYFSYYDINNEPLGFDYFKMYVNYTIDNRTILNEQLFDNFLFVDDESTINFNVYDTFNVLIASIEEPETTFIKITLNIYSLKVKNEAVEPVSYVLQNPESSIEKSSNIFPDEIIEFKIASGNYIFDYINGEDNALRELNFTLNDNKIVVINSTYYQLYVSCFNFDGLGLDTDWVRLYINNLRKDFGFNTLKTEYTHFVVMDYFNATLKNETIYTRMYTEYNLYIQVYNMILNNNYTHSIYITIERPDVNITIKQIIPAQGSINYRFLPDVNYNISHYYINGTIIDSTNVTLTNNNQIISFGYYSEEVPSPYYQLLVSCFNFNGFKLDTNWVYLYINGIQSDFGSNTMMNEYNYFVITDLFGEILSSEIVYTKNCTQYNADVVIYGMILNNNYTYSIYIEMTRPNTTLIMKQIIPAQSGVLYKFCPDTDYVISYYHINGTKIGDKRITLDTNNQIVSFGFYSEEVPSFPVEEIVKFENSMFLDIIVIILCFIIVIAVILYFYRKIYKKNKQQQQYIYNKNINKKKLEVDGLFGKIK